MTQTIEQLTARVRELEEDNARLKAECDDIKQVQFPRKLEAVAVSWKKQLAASQAYAKQLRAALKRILCDEACFEESENPSDWPANVALEALSIPNDTSVLDAYVADKVKEAVSTQKEYYESVFQDGAKRIATLTRQRDLAVEALKTAYEVATNHDNRLPFDWAVYCEMLWQSIKESEAMAQGEKK